MGMPVKKEGEKSWPDGAATRMHTNDYRKFSDAEKKQKSTSRSSYRISSS